MLRKISVGRVLLVRACSICVYICQYIRQMYAHAFGRILVSTICPKSYKLSGL